MNALKPLAAAMFAAALAAGGIAACGTSNTGTERTAGQVLDDATMTARVKTALAKEPGVSALAINVDTARGVVSLHGRVATQEEATRAVNAAKRVSGVRSVINNLEVRPA